jgi:hypothetical protein
LTIVILSAIFAIGGEHNTAQAEEEVCSQLPQDAIVTDSQFDHWTQSDGTEVVVAYTSYVLTTGDEAFAYVVFDSNDAGEVYYGLNGDVVLHTSYRESSTLPRTGTGPVTETWVNPVLFRYPQEALVELSQDSVGTILLGGLVPQPFKCSAWGKKVLKGAKYLWVGASAAVGAACCAGGGVGCILCAAGAAAAGQAGADVADGYCD